MEAFTAAAGDGNPTRFEDNYMRMVDELSTQVLEYA